MRIEQQLSIPAQVDRVWEFLLDVPTMAKCIPGAEAVQELDPEHFTLRMKTRVGPIAATFECQIAVIKLDRDSHSGAFEISGRDTRLGAGLRAITSFNLSDQGAETNIRLKTEADIAGRIAQYGHGIIRQRADATLQSFGDCVRSKLA
jgi:carbon monoxide dehydrogenase subunit G